MKLVTMVWLCLLAGSVAVAAPQQFYVSHHGRDDWSGRLAAPNADRSDGPFATLTRARDAAHALPESAGEVKVVVRGGVYELAEPLELTDENSVGRGASMAYWAYTGETVRLLGGKLVSNWQPLTDESVLSRLDPATRGQVVTADLKALGITDFGSPGGRGLEVFFNDRPMTLARYPNQGFIRIVRPLGKTERNVRGTKGTVEGVFEYEDDRPARWRQEADPWVHGYWFWDWSEQRHRIKSIDPERHVIEVQPPYHGYGYRKGQWFYGFNLLGELDQPGEWYLDRASGKLYFWPPAKDDQSSLAAARSGETLVTVLPKLVSMKNVSRVTLRGFILEGCRGTAIEIEGGEQNRIVGCTVRNVGGWAVVVRGGRRHGVVGCDMYQMGGGGISLNGGDRKTLTPARHFAENNHIHHYARVKRVYQPGITLQGVGNVASHNLIHDAPHMGMGFGGNDHRIEYNEIHSVCYESNDAGAIYTGRDWTQRGTVIRRNYLHHIQGFRGRGCVGVYLDDMFSGTEISGNLFYEVTRAAFIGGGRDNLVESNLFIDCRPALHIDNRAQGWAASAVPGVMKQRLDAMPYKSPLWVQRYPSLINVWEDEPAAPKGNRVLHNVSWGGRWEEVSPGARKYVTIESNLTDQDPGLRTPDRIAPDKNPRPVDFRLRGESPAWKVGFKPLPLEQIGLHPDPARASWPVAHHPRPLVERPQPASAKRKGPPPVFKVTRRKPTVQLDGDLKPGEWLGVDPAKAMVIEQGIHGEKISPRSLVWLFHDGANLYAGIDNLVDAKHPVSRTNQWGQDDAVEVALRNPAGGRTAPIFVLRGYPNGHFESSTEAGAPSALADRAQQAVGYAARIQSADRWTAEFVIPLSALGIDLAKHAKLEFNITVRKSAAPVWVMWQGTSGYSWQVDRAGFISCAP